VARVAELKNVVFPVLVLPIKPILIIWYYRNGRAYLYLTTTLKVRGGHLCSGRCIGNKSFVDKRANIKI